MWSSGYSYSKEKFEGYTKQEVEKSKLTRDLQGMVGHPIDRKYKDMVTKKLLQNCPITTHDITNADYMFGPNLACLRVNTVRNKPIRVYTEEYVKIRYFFTNCTSL